MLTQRPGFVNGRFYIIVLAATLGVISAGLVERRPLEPAPSPLERVPTTTGGSFLVGDWFKAGGLVDTSVQSQPASKSTWSHLGAALRSVTHQPVAAVAFRSEELQTDDCWQVCYDEPVELEAPGVEAVEGCPVELFDEVALQGFL